MNSIVLDNEWSYTDSCGEKSVYLPFAAPVGEAVTLKTHLPLTSGRAVLEIDGAKGGADVYMGGQCVAAVGERRAFVDISKWIAPDVELAIGLSDGGAINRYVKLHECASDIAVKPYGVFVSTTSFDGVGAVLNVNVDVENLGEKRKFALEFNVLNHRGKRVSRKRKYFTFGEGERTVVVPVGMRRAVPYQPADPYIYTMSVSIATTEGETLDTSVVRFGIATYGVDLSRKFVGCTLTHSCGVTGSLSFPESEMRKLSALRDLGYNTVRYIGCPSENALAVTDDLGLSVIVDLFDNWSHPRGCSRAHATFDDDYKTVVRNAVKSLRNHPSVVMYSLGNALEESYGRAGSERAKDVASLVRSLDDTRPVTSALAELVPLVGELTAHGIPAEAIDPADKKGMVELGREVGLFEKSTRDFTDLLDVVGYVDCPVEYARADKPAVGLATTEARYFDALYETVKNDMLLGDLSACGMDCKCRPGQGDIDATSLARSRGLYRSAILGGQSFILASDDENITPTEAKPSWNFDVPEGTIVKVYVFTPGDVVALYLNGELVGRRLAGRVNKYIAAFEVEYRPGTLEAVVFAKGYESDRCTLETTGEPFRVKLMTGARRVSVSGDEPAFIDVWIMDADGKVVTDSDCELNFEYTNCVPVAVGNRDGASDCPNTCVAAGGHALVVVRASALTEDAKLIVKADGAKLRAGRAVVKVIE